MLRLITIAVVVVPLVALLGGCPPKPAAGELPPAGLAGAPGAPTATPSATGPSSMPAPSAALTTLPGAGMNVAAPSGGVPSSGELPPGHPPIDTAPTQPMAPIGGGGGMGGAPAQDVQLTGSVLEAVDVPEYTYLRIKTTNGEEWAAVNKTPVNVGDVVTVSSQLVMNDFTSKTLNKKFDRLVMGMLVGAPKKP